MPPMLLWDNDGVLVDTEPWYFRATAEVLAERGLRLTEAEFQDLSLTQGRSAFDLLPRELDAATVAELRDRRNRRFGEYLARGGHLVPGADEVLRSLSPRHRMAVVTSCRREHFEVAHRDTGLLCTFEFVLTLEDLCRTKPSPDPYLMALERAALAAEDAIAIEDSPRGVRAAVAAGIRCLAIPRGPTRGGDFSGAAAVLHDVRAVPAALERLAQGEIYGRVGTAGDPAG